MGEGSVAAALLDSFLTLHALMALAQLSPDVGGKFTWRFSSNGIYSAYRLQFAGAVDFPFAPLIWKLGAMPRCHFFAWLFVQNRLMTANRLLTREWPNGYICPLCMRNLETSLHLFIDCLHSRWIWKRVAAYLRITQHIQQ
jgi:hypothetical protein